MSNTNSEIQVQVPLVVLQQIDRLARDIEQPVVSFRFDDLEMAHSAIKFQMEQATLIRRLLPGLGNLNNP